jgi:hypothetical protein
VRKGAEGVSRKRAVYGGYAGGNIEVGCEGEGDGGTLRGCGRDEVVKRGGWIFWRG